MKHHPSTFQARSVSLFSSHATVRKKPQSSLNQSMDDAMLSTHHNPSFFSKQVGFEEDRVRVQHPLTSERFKSVPKKWSKSPSFQKQGDQPHDGSQSDIFVASPTLSQASVASSNYIRWPGTLDRHGSNIIMTESFNARDEFPNLMNSEKNWSPPIHLNKYGPNVIVLHYRKKPYYPLHRLLTKEFF